jgi:threonine 3-dehydrogenase
MSAAGDYALLMKTAEGPGGVELRRRPHRAPAEGEVLVRIRRAAICGTDLHILGWNAWAARSYRLPLPLGHEFSGEVAALGPGVSGLGVGDRVTAETHLACGRCAQCRIGRGHTCLNLRVFTRLGEGAFSEYATVPAQLLRRIPPGIAHRHACLMEPLGIAFRAAEEAGCAGGALLVSGAGPIGLLAVAAARALGVARVAVAEPSAARRQLAVALGADAAWDPRAADADSAAAGVFGIEGPDAAIDASGNTGAIRAALAGVRPGGTVVLAGLPAAPVELDLATHVVLREITLRGVYGRKLDATWDAVGALLPRLAGALDRLITHEFALADFEQAFAAALAGDAGKIQFVLD